MIQFSLIVIFPDSFPGWINWKIKLGLLMLIWSLVVVLDVWIQLKEKLNM